MKLESIYLLLVPALLSVSCSSDPEQSGSERVPIELHASGGGTVTTKADQTITESFPTTVFASLRDGDYTGLTSISPAGYEWIKDTEVAINGTVSLPDDPAYPENGSWIYLIAVSPQVSSSYQSAAGTVSYTLTGQDDLMYARQIKGNRWDGSRFSNNADQALVTPLNYIHLLTQLKFKAQKAAVQGLPVKVSSITVKGVANRMTLNINNGEATFEENSDLSLILAEGGKEISSTNASDLGALLLPPLGSGKSYKVTIETSIGKFEDLSIDFTGSGNPSDNLFAKGHSYEITFNISDSKLEILSVTVASWEPVPSGDIDLID